MAFTDDQKYSIIFALCHEGKILSPNSTSYSKIFADRLENLPAQVEARALELVTSIEELKTALSSYQKDNVKRIGDIELDTKMSRSNKQKELKRLLEELSQLLDISNRCKVGGGGMGCLVL
jgi:hypothetical protein